MTGRFLVAAGTGGVELTPLAGVDEHGQPRTAFHVAPRAGQQAHEKFVLRNLTATPSDVELYAASVTKSPSGAYAVGGEGSAPWISLTPQQVRLAAHAVRTYRFDVVPDKAPKGGGIVYAAIVVQQARGNVVQRAATLVYLGRQGPSPVEHILIPAAIAAALIGVVVIGLAWRRRRGERDASGGPPAPAAEHREPAGVG